MKYLLTLFFVALSAMFGWLTIDALQTQRFIPKSEKYPILKAEQPIMYWLGVSTCAVMIFMCLYLALIIWRDKGPEEE